MTNHGLHIELYTIYVPAIPGMIVGYLNCCSRSEVNFGADRSVVLPLCQMPTQDGSKLVLRVPNVPLINLPMWLWNTQNITRRQLYITTEPDGYSDFYLYFTFAMADFDVSESYPPMLHCSPAEISRFGTADVGRSFGKVLFASRCMPPSVYIRLSSTHNLNVLVKLVFMYDCYDRPMQAECSIAAMSPDKSLLELLLLNNCPTLGDKARLSRIRHNHILGCTQKLRCSNVNVNVSVKLINRMVFSLAVTIDEAHANQKPNGKENSEHEQLADIE